MSFITFSSSVFEGIRVYNKKSFFLEDHIERLFKSCEIMGLNEFRKS